MLSDLRRLGLPQRKRRSPQDDREEIVEIVRNAAGELLLRCDDWSTGAVGGVSPVNDFSPTVATYGERQIAATGFAPANRREPCVLADLPPGAYTVVARPFEFRDPDPARDQPAKPGVALLP